jgi:hypothetical protein
MGKRAILSHNKATLTFLLAGKCYATLEPVLPPADGPKSVTYKIDQKTTDRTVTSESDLDVLKAKAYGVDFVEPDSEPKAREALKVGQTARVRERHEFWFVGIVPGAIGDSKARYLGVIDPNTFRTTKGTKKNGLASSYAINWFGDIVRDLRAGVSNEHQMRIWHTGRCGKCGKELKLPKSIATGLGPVCAKYLGVEMVDPSPTLVDKIAALGDANEPTEGKKEVGGNDE